MLRCSFREPFGILTWTTRFAERLGNTVMQNQPFACLLLSALNPCKPPPCAIMPASPFVTVIKLGEETEGSRGDACPQSITHQYYLREGALSSSNMIPDILIVVNLNEKKAY